MNYFITMLLTALLFSCDKSPSEPEPDVENETILFYALEPESPFSSIYTIGLDGSDLTLIDRGMCSYPVWYNDKNTILYLNHGNYQLVFKDLKHQYAQDSIVHLNDNILFLRYARSFNSIVFSHWQAGISQIARMDLETFNVMTVDSSTNDRKNPVCNRVDNWIYFSQYNGSSYGICRIYYDGSNFETILCDSSYDFTTFSVSADGNLLVSPRYRIRPEQSTYESYIVVFDLKSRSVLYEIPFEGTGVALYSSLTFDDKYILFVNGIPDNYTTPRNIFRMEIDGSNLEQITFFENRLAVRPLTW